MEKPKLPEFKVNSNRNGYELRTDILAYAQKFVTDDFYARWAGWEFTQVKDKATGQLITKVAMPEFPGIDKVLDAANKMYEFVNKTPDLSAKK